MTIDLSPARLTRGAIAGLVASVAMGMYAMIASVVHDTGFFTPLYHIASSVGSSSAMMESMQAAASGDSTTFVAGSALLGAVIHMMVGAIAGIVFAVLIGLRPVSLAITVVAGIVYGLFVMAVNSLIMLPITASIFGGGDPIADMGRVAGWTTFTIEHIVYGLVLGLLVAMAPATSRTDSPSHTAHK